MEPIEELNTALLRFGKQMTKASIIIDGIIASVDLTKYTCEVTVSVNMNGEDVDYTYFDIPIKVLKGSQASLIEIPTVGTTCLINFRDNNVQRPQIYQVDKCDKILIQIAGDNGTQTLEISADGFVFNEGKQGGMVILQNVVDRLNNLEDDINKLRSAFNQWIIIPSDGGAALKTAAATWMSKSLEKTKTEDLANQYVKQ